MDTLIADSQTGFDGQTGFIKGRFIGENTRFISDLMEYTELNKIPELLMLYAFEKAFNSISWSVNYKVVQFWGFGKKYY